MLDLGRFSLGIGDRFAHQAAAQLSAFVEAQKVGVEITPVWNKSFREHTIVGSEPGSVRLSADRAVNELGWTASYFVDADHIRLNTVDRFLDASDFFTIDVADSIGQTPVTGEIDAFLGRHPELTGAVTITGIEAPFAITFEQAAEIAGKYLGAVREAGDIYRHIESAKGRGNFVTEISMDETDLPQKPIDLLVILAAIADEKIPIQTIAPKFTGRFNKGVDYVGDAVQFEREFNDDLCVIAHAVTQYGLPSDLKLSVHSGSDKFSIYPAIRRALACHNAGVHVKTAGTTWLEELIGLAEADGDGLEAATSIYVHALEKREALCAPYSSVIDIDVTKLPAADEVARWSSEQFVRALRHDPSCPEFNPSLRQLLHVGFKVAAQMGDEYLQLLRTFEPTISRNVRDNLLERHIRTLFLTPA